MTKATPAGRTLTEDPPAASGGNPRIGSPAEFVGRLPGSTRRPADKTAGRFLLCGLLGAQGRAARGAPHGPVLALALLDTDADHRVGIDAENRARPVLGQPA